MGSPRDLYWVLCFLLSRKICFPFNIRPVSDVIMYAKDTSVLISNSNYNEFKHTFLVIIRIVTWFHANLLILNMNKTDIVKFTTISVTSDSLSFEYANILLTEVPKFKF